MKVRMSREELLTGLQRVQGVVEKRNTMPILANIRLEARDQGVDILATDLELWMRGLYKATVEESGSVTISARKLYEILREVREDDIELTVTEGQWVGITAGRSRFKVVGLPSTDYPTPPEIERDALHPLPAPGMLELLRKTLFAVGDNDARYVLNGVLVTLSPADKKQVLRLVGTDGHRLALAEKPLNNGTTLPEQEIKAIIPKKAAHEMRRLLEDGDQDPVISFTKNMMVFRKNGLLLMSRLMDGNYPNYQQVIPKEGQRKVVVDRAAFEGALRRVSLLSRDKAYALKMTFAPGGLTVFSSNPDYGEATEELAAEYQGESLTSGFNARYFLDVLSAMDGDSVSLHMETPLSPCLIREPGNANFTCVVMPIKV